MNTLKNDIAAYIKRAGLSRRAFGQKAMGDPKFVFEIEAGRRCWPATEARVREYMASNPVPSTADEVAA